jgi:hypothetical protein
MTFRGVFSGLVALTLLQAVLSSTKSAERTAGIWSAVTSGFARFMSPTVAAIPDIRDRVKWDTVAPGDPGKIPYSSTTLPDDWTTKPAAPAAPRTLAV